MRISVVADANCVTDITCGYAQFTTHINHDQNCYEQGTDTHMRWTPICSYAHICGGWWEQLGEHMLSLQKELTCSWLWSFAIDTDTIIPYL